MGLDRYPALGIPVRWADISQARVVVEAATGNFRVEPSQGTHFFQNLTLPWRRLSHGRSWGGRRLRQLRGSTVSMPCSTTNMVSDRICGPLSIAIDGRSGRGIVKNHPIRFHEFLQQHAPRLRLRR